jgi:electron transfer flavoprotein alpha subunit
MAKKIWVYVDHFKGETSAAAWEGFKVAADLAKEVEGVVSAIVIGDSVNTLTESAYGYGASQVFVLDNSAVLDYVPETYASAISAKVKEETPDIILFPTSTRGRELSAIVGVDLSAGVMPDVTEILVDDGGFVASRPIYAGKLTAKVKSVSAIQIFTLRARAFGKPEFSEGKSGETVLMELPNIDGSTKVVDYVSSEGGVSLTDANVIISGGRGVSNNPNLEPPAEITDDKEKEIWKAQQGFKLVGDLASVLNAAVGASRAAVDADYIPYKNQVGQTGKVVSPDLYIACGISGAIQHLAGMRSSKLIVAINKDADAPIFKVAKYGVVGDLFEILPPLVEAMKTRLGK